MTTNGRPAGLALLTEVARILAAHGALRCTPLIEEEDGQWTLAVTFHAATADEGLETLSLADELRYVADVGQMRGLCERYGIAPQRLEWLLREPRPIASDGGVATPLTCAELDRVIAVLEASADPDDDHLLDPAIAKLRAAMTDGARP